MSPCRCLALTIPKPRVGSGQGHRVRKNGASRAGDSPPRAQVERYMAGGGARFTFAPPLSVLSRDTIMEEFSPGAPACAATIPKSQQSILPPQARNTALIITEIVRSSLQSLSVLNVEA